jgi:hypothetical protein
MQRRASSIGLVVCAAAALNTAGATVAVVDAVSAATVNNTCNFVTPIPVTATTATVQWTEGRTEGTATIAGDTINPPVNRRAVTAPERAATTVQLSGLKPSTRYYLYYEATKVGEMSYAASGSFATLANAAVLNPVVHATKSAALREGDVLTFLDAGGRRIARQTVSSQTQLSLTRVPTAGVYLVQVTRGGRVVLSSPAAALSSK